MKQCKKCDQSKDRSEFYINRAMKDGLQSYCKDCLSPSKRNLNLQALREALPEGMRLCTRCHKGKPHDAFNKHKRGKDGLDQRCKECRKPETRNYHVLNKSKINAKEQARRAKLKDAYVEGAYIPSAQQLARWYGKACLVPGCEAETPTVDHIIAIKNGGMHEVGNLQPLCQSHNASKNCHHDTDYRDSNTGRGVLLSIARIK